LVNPKYNSAAFIHHQHGSQQKPSGFYPRLSLFIKVTKVTFLKTQIITLESHDDLISVRDKFSWAKTPRILLVWPKYEKVTLRLLDLKVLQRHADSLGAQLGLVTRRANVRRDAEALGIPVFASTTTAQKDLWPQSAPRTRRIPRPPRRNLRKLRDVIYGKEASWRTSLLGRVITFTVGVMAVLTVAGLFVPRAALTLYPEAQIQSVVIPVSASQSVDSVSVTGAIPARVLSVTVSAEQSLTVTSKIAVPKLKSHGVVRFTNLGQTEVIIPAATVVLTQSSVRFVTLHETKLPAGIDEFVDIPIEALLLGVKGNVSADEITIVEGPLGLSVAAVNPGPVTGGTDVQVVGATDNDRSKLSDMVFENLRKSAEDQMRARIQADDLLLADTFEAANILQEEFDPPVGQAGNILLLKMEVEFTARYISASDLEQLAQSTLNASVADGFSPFGDTDLKPLADPVTDPDGATHFDLEVSRILLRDVDQTQVFSMIRGHNPQRARTELLDVLSLRKSPDVIVTPSWWPWLPLIPFNISVEVK
jgi:hypothetical protein